MLGSGSHCFSPKDGCRHFQIKEKVQKSILIPGNMLPNGFLLCSLTFLLCAVLLLILIMEYNFQHKGSGSSLRQAKLLPESPRGRQMEKQCGLELHAILTKDTMGSFHINVTTAV